MANEIKSEPTKDLVAGLLSDAKDLATGHVGRMQHEISDEFKNLKTVMLRIAVGVGAGVVGSILLGHTLAAVLIALGLPAWAGYGIAAVMLITVGYLLVRHLSTEKGKSDLVPEESIAKLKRDMQQVSHAVRS